jgi:serine/threonine protein kinase
MEYCPGGSLSSVLAKFGALDDDVARNYTGQILCGLDYLHRHCIVHRFASRHSLAPFAGHSVTLPCSLADRDHSQGH